MKKRRFFTEDSLPVQVRSRQPDSPPRSPPQDPAATEQRPDESTSTIGGGDFGGFDVDMLQAVVGELPSATLVKLKDVSGSDVQRGLHSLPSRPSNILTLSSNQPLP